LSPEQSDLFPGVPVAPAPVVPEEPDAGYDPAAPVEPVAPYRGPWKDSGGMCSASCPAIRQVPGFSRPYSDCMVTGYRVEPKMWPCEVRSIWEAVKRGPEP
jgi:hypothetical protein